MILPINANLLRFETVTGTTGEQLQFVFQLPGLHIQIEPLSMHQRAEIEVGDVLQVEGITLIAA